MIMLHISGIKSSLAGECHITLLRVSGHISLRRTLLSRVSYCSVCELANVGHISNGLVRTLAGITVLCLCQSRCINGCW